MAIACAKILVSVGDTVKVGQVVEIVDSSSRLQDAFQKTQEQINVAFSKLAQVKAGAKVGKKINDAGIADLAQTDKMVAVTEVYQTDITAVFI